MPHAPVWRRARVRRAAVLDLGCYSCGVRSRGDGHRDDARRRVGVDQGAIDDRDGRLADFASGARPGSQREGDRRDGRLLVGPRPEHRDGLE